MKDQLKSFFTNYWGYLAVSAACELNIFDNLVTPKTIQQLSEKLSLNSKTLGFLLNSLNEIGFLSKKQEQFQINKLSEFLTENHPESLKYACLNWSKEHLTAWQNLSYSIKTGESAFEKVYNTSFFEYLTENPEKTPLYHKAMYEYARDDYKELPNIVNFGKHKTVMDVGGGYGALITNIAEKNPLTKCILFDLGNVIKDVVFSNIDKIEGDFFCKIPVKTEAIILSRILHDWNDEKATLILKNCFEALTEKGNLYIIENCIDKTNINLSMLSLNMIVMCESYERTFEEYSLLTKKVGFSFLESLKVNTLQTLLIFQK
jgi:caffeic acid 3-O-methyltransferase 3